MVEKLFFYEKLKKAPAWFAHTYAMVLVIVGWMIFAIEDIRELMTYLGIMLGMGGADFISSQAMYYLKNYFFVLIVLVLASLPIGKNIYSKIKESVKIVFEPLAIALVLIVCTAYLVDSTYNPFLYFRF